MFHNLLQLVNRRPSPGCEPGFVEVVRLVDYRPERNPRVEKVILACWLLIAAKCYLVTWLVARYHMNFSPLWVNAPTITFALICTAVYFTRE